MPEQTREAIDEEGWFYTGDLATFDKRGTFGLLAEKKK